MFVEVYTLVLHDKLGEGVPVRTATVAAALAASNACMRERGLCVPEPVNVRWRWWLAGLLQSLWLPSLCICHASMLYVYNNCICSLGRMQYRRLAVVLPHGHACVAVCCAMCACVVDAMCRGGRAVVVVMVVMVVVVVLVVVVMVAVWMPSSVMVMVSALLPALLLLLLLPLLLALPHQILLLSLIHI